MQGTPLLYAGNTFPPHWHNNENVCINRWHTVRKKTENNPMIYPILATLNNNELIS